MHSNLINLKRAKLRIIQDDNITLSDYFPGGTCYFYGYPSGEESGFLNRVPPKVEELVSARPFACAGKEVKVVSFANAIDHDSSALLNSKFLPPMLPNEQVLMLPKGIDANLTGKQRNMRVKESLKRYIKPGTLVMAQPFMDKDLQYLYQIPPKLSNWLNDKNNMSSYVPVNLLPLRYEVFQNGQAFAKMTNKIPTPCVVKVSSSSAGDGVYICHDQSTIKVVKNELQQTLGTIFVEEYVEAVANYGIQFGIPYDKEKPIDLIGVNKQITTSQGQFIGGIVDPNNLYPELAKVKEVLITQLLPYVRKLGWHGVGCFDVLVDNNGACYMIDANFRMTGMTAYLMLSANRQITKSLVSFNGEFSGTLTELNDVFLSLSTDEQKIHVLALTPHNKTCGLNAALLFDSYDEIPTLAQALIDRGIHSTGLNILAQST